MGKILLATGIILAVITTLLSIVVLMPVEWFTYLLGKGINLFNNSPHHIYFKVVPSSDNYSYVVLVILFIISAIFIHYGKKLQNKVKT